MRRDERADDSECRRIGDLLQECDTAIWRLYRGIANWCIIRGRPDCRERHPGRVRSTRDRR